MTLFDPGAPDPRAVVEVLSVDRRRTIKNAAILADGRHPATGLHLADNGETCGTCAHHHAYDYHNRGYHKCDVHRLGESHSAASDIRVSWPACTQWSLVAVAPP